MVAAWLIGVGLSAIRATAARNGLEDLDLFAVLADSEMTDEDGAVHAGTGAQALKAGVVRLYGVVILGGWGCAWGALDSCVSTVNLQVLWAGSRGVRAPAGPFTWFHHYLTFGPQSLPETLSTLSRASLTPLV